jgi:hypothetical protein
MLHSVLTSRRERDTAIDLRCWLNVLLQVIAKSPLGAKIRSHHVKPEANGRVLETWEWIDFIAYFSHMLNWRNVDITEEALRLEQKEMDEVNEVFCRSLLAALPKPAIDMVPVPVPEMDVSEIICSMLSHGCFLGSLGAKLRLLQTSRWENDILSVAQTVHTLSDGEHPGPASFEFVPINEQKSETKIQDLNTLVERLLFNRPKETPEDPIELMEPSSEQQTQPRKRSRKQEKSEPDPKQQLRLGGVMPEMITFQLGNRNVPTVLPADLELKPYRVTKSSEEDLSCSSYKLGMVVVRQDLRGEVEGHYYVEALNPVGKKWFRINDEEIEVMKVRADSYDCVHLAFYFREDWVRE